MREPRFLGVEEVAVGAIGVADRLRPVSEEAAAAIAASVRETGVMKDEPLVRRIRHRDGALALIAGAHRLAAARLLGWERIRVKLYDCSDDWARLMEIDDNLAHAELSPLELATFLAERKAVHLRAFPETAWGGDRRSEKFQTKLCFVWSDGGEARPSAVSFSRMIAEKRGLTPQQVRKYLRAGERLTPGALRELRAGSRPTPLQTLLRLAAAPEELQAAAAREWASGRAKTPQEALTLAAGKPVPPPPDRADAALLRLSDLFGRAPMEGRRRFIRHLWEFHRDLLEQEAPE